MMTPSIDIPPHRPAAQRGELLLTPLEAAEVLSISRSLLYGLIMHKRIFSVKVGGARRIPLQALQAYVDLSVAQRRKRWASPWRENRETSGHDSQALGWALGSPHLARQREAQESVRQDPPGSVSAHGERQTRS